MSLTLQALMSISIPDLKLMLRESLESIRKEKDKRRLNEKLLYKSDILEAINTKRFFDLKCKE